MHARLHPGLSKRERQIVDAVYSRKSATAAEVRASIPDPPSYSAVRATLSVLLKKGILSCRRERRRYVYTPTVPHETARRSALRHLLETYFDGSVHDAMAALIRVNRRQLSDEGYRSLDQMIKKIEKAGPP